MTLGKHSSHLLYTPKELIKLELELFDLEVSHFGKLYVHPMGVEPTTSCSTHTCERREYQLRQGSLAYYISLNLSAHYFPFFKFFALWCPHIEFPRKELDIKSKGKKKNHV